jgi:TetR/AcrR family transcriptional regulator, regulator of biofilm formation and stress response
MDFTVKAHEADEVPQARATRRRGIARRNAILETVLELLAERGSASTTVRAVAQAAEVPLAAMTYYFSTKSQLLREAFALHANREGERVALVGRGIEGAASADEIAGRLVRFVLDGLVRHRNRLIAEYELLVCAARDPELAELSRVWQYDLKNDLAETLCRAGSQTPLIDAQVLLALCAGLEIDTLAGSGEVHATEIRLVVERAVHALLGRQRAAVTTESKGRE